MKWIVFDEKLKQVFLFPFFYSLAINRKWLNYYLSLVLLFRSRKFDTVSWRVIELPEANREEMFRREYGFFLFIATELLSFVTMHSVQPVPTCVKTFCDRCRLDQISSANLACNKRVEILKLEFSLPVWLIEHTNHRYWRASTSTLTGF